METNDYNKKKMLVFSEVLKDNLHIREISRKTKINPMTTKKILDELTRENILNFKREGKNKCFYLKKNIEVRNMKIIYEVYKKIEVIRKFPVLRGIFEKIEENRRIVLATLFGSYAKDLAHKNSDIDIYIETEDLSLKKNIEKINSKISVKMGKFKKEEFLMKEIMKNHVIIKGFEKYYERTN